MLLLTSRLTLFCCAFLLAYAEIGKQHKIRYPLNRQPYEPNIIRKWRLGSPDGTCLEFKLLGLHMELSPNCNNDYLDVFDGATDQAPRRMHICGQPIPVPRAIRSTSNKLLVVFTSNANYETGRGYEAMVTEIACNEGGGDGSAMMSGMSYQPPMTPQRPVDMNRRPSCGFPRTQPIENGLYARQKRHQEPTDYDGGVSEGEGRIVGGQIARQNSWPWQVSIRYNGMHICGGSVLSSRAILSAAHCFKSISRNPDDFEFWVGKHLKDQREPQSEQQVYGETIRLHPNYEKGGRKHDNDLALILLQSPGITFTSTVTPVCLPWNSNFQPRDGGACYVTGFGTTKGTGGDDELKQAAVPIVDNERCKAMDARLQPLITKNMMCAGYEEGKHDSCQGDSGGPLVCKIGPQGSWVLSGVVSFGFGCAGSSSPGVYVRVTEFLPWLRDNVPDLPN